MPKVNTPLAPIYAINKPYYDVADYGNLPSTGIPDGVASNSAMILAAANAANAAGGGVVFLGEGTWRGKGLPLYPGVYYLGAGIGATTIKLEDGANTDLFSANTGSINLSASLGTGSNTAVADWGMEALTLDGNQANQTSGTSYPLRVYGRSYILQNIDIRNGRSGGILCDYNGTADPTEDSPSTKWINVNVHDNTGFGIETGGPSDSQWHGVQSFHNTSAAFHICPNAAGLQAGRCHGYTSGSLLTGMPTWLVETSDATFIDCECEGSNDAMVAILGSHITWKARIFPGGTATGAGVKIGQQAGQTPYAGQIYQSAGVTTAVAPQGCNIDVSCYGLTSTNGAIWLANDGGNNIKATVIASSGNYISGTASGFTTLEIWGNGLTGDGTNGKGGVLQIQSNSFAGYTIGSSGSGVLAFVVDTFDNPPFISIPNNTVLQMYSDNFSTKTLQMRGGTVCLAQSATAPDPGAGGTINTAGVGIARVNPGGGSRSGCILQAGTQPGQMVVVVNENAANTITFAASGTSHVALGAGVVVAANGKQVLVWDSSASLWY